MPNDCQMSNGWLEAYRFTVVIKTIADTLWIQTLSEKVLGPLNQAKSKPKYFLRRYLDPFLIRLYRIYNHPQGRQ